MMKPNRLNIPKSGTRPPEFREEAVRYWLSSGETLKQVASDLGVRPNVCACGDARSTAQAKKGP